MAVVLPAVIVSGLQPQSGDNDLSPFGGGLPSSRGNEPGENRLTPSGTAFA
jgi:hypothetical protein